jgi:DNA gyrase subunit B
VFIAQPPLYKVWKGKDEAYLANDQELTAYVIRKATEGKEVEIPAANRKFIGTELHHLLQDLIDYDHLIETMGRYGVGRRVVETLLDVPDSRNREFFETKENLDRLAEAFAEHGHEVRAVDQRQDTGLYGIDLRSSDQHRKRFRVNFETAQMVEMRKLRHLEETVRMLNDPPILVRHGDEEESIGSKEELLAHLMEAGKKGLHIQRYKGLGEMNPGQLWETTMDPDKRRVLEVQIEDAAEADTLFSILMGDAVEPRRNFIEENALDVQNLDI